MREVFHTMRYLLQCRSLTYAQRAEHVLERAGVTGTVTRMPRSAGARGCAYGVLVSPRQLAAARSALDDAGLSPEKIYIRENNGAVREVKADDLA